MRSVTTRAATVDDVDSLYTMLGLMAAALRPGEPSVASADSLKRDGFGPIPKFEATIAEYGGRPCGFALWTTNYSTWEGRPGLFIETSTFTSMHADLALGAP